MLYNFAIMLKLLAVIAVSAVIQAPQPAPRGTSASPGNASSSSNDQGKPHQTDAAHPIATVELVAAIPADQHAGQQAAYDSEHRVTLTSLPPVTIAEGSKTFLDYVFAWGPWVFSLFTLAIGGLQIWLLWRTWERIDAQEKRMAEQVKEMKDAREISTKTLILQYRPRIIVRLATAKFSKEIGEGVFSEPVRCAVTFQIVNTGGSLAHIIEGDIYLLSARRGSSPEEEIEFKESTHIGISERTLHPGGWEVIEFGLDTGIPNDARWIEAYKGVSSHAIFLLGTVWYRDELGIPRRTGLHREYDPKNRRFVRHKDSEEEYSD